MYGGKILVSKAKAGSGFCDEFLLNNPNAVVYVFRHTSKGATGIILNGPSVGPLNTVYMKDVFDTPQGNYEKFKEMVLSGEVSNLQLFLAGSQKTKGVFFMHGHKEFSGIENPMREQSVNDFMKFAYDDFESTRSKFEVLDGVYFGTPHTFAHIAESGKLAEKKYKFFTGEARWIAGQLDTEVQAGYWTVINPEIELFFDPDKCESLAQSFKTKKPSFYSRIQPSLN